MKLLIVLGTVLWAFVGIVMISPQAPVEIHRDTVLNTLTMSQQELLMDRIQVHEGWKKGSRSYRNNNPGNLEYNKYTSKYPGAVKSDGRFVIFASYEDGRNGLRHLLFNTKTYPTLTIEQMVNRYAPSNENNVEAYIRALVDKED